MGRVTVRDIQYAIQEMGGDSERARINMRAEQVRDRYRQALEAVYHNESTLFLQHTNNVYIFDKNGVKTLIVYVDESIFAAELNAQRELVKLQLLQLFGEDIGEFEIHISRGRYREEHPYLTELAEKSDKKSPSIPLDQTETAYVSNTVSKIEDQTLRKSLERAMTADLEWKKGEKVEKPAKDR